MGLGDDQEMGGRLGVDVVKGVHQLVLVNLVGGISPAAICKTDNRSCYILLFRGFDSSIGTQEAECHSFEAENRGPRMLPRPRSCAQQETN